MQIVCKELTIEDWDQTFTIELQCNGKLTFEEEEALRELGQALAVFLQKKVLIVLSTTYESIPFSIRT